MAASMLYLILGGALVVTLILAVLIAVVLQLTKSDR